MGTAFLPVWWALVCCAWVLWLCWHITGIIREGTERGWVGGIRQPWTRLPERACDNRHDTRQGGPELRCSGDLGLNPATGSTESSGT